MKKRVSIKPGTVQRLRRTLLTWPSRPTEGFEDGASERPDRGCRALAEHWRYRDVTGAWTLPRVTPQLTPPLSTAVLLVALEQSAPRARIESALVLLGQRAEALDRAAALGLLRVTADRLEVVDARLARVTIAQATDRERRLAHLALACSRTRRTVGSDGRSAFDALSAALDGAPALPPQRPGQEEHREALTPRERDVAELAATGLPTREIAAAAYLSQKTVEYHLTRVYRKLGVRSKSELAFAFAGGMTHMGH